jgi:hypothetical protein
MASISAKSHQQGKPYSVCGYLLVLVSEIHFLLAFNVGREVLPNQEVVTPPIA